MFFPRKPAACAAAMARCKRAAAAEEFGGCEFAEDSFRSHVQCFTQSLVATERLVAVERNSATLAHAAQKPKRSSGRAIVGLRNGGAKAQIIGLVRQARVQSV